jgi:pimeloyl-ACP methyl ester carboxylesterase
MDGLRSVSGRLEDSMPIARVRGISLAYETFGAGDPVLLLPPAATPSGIWSMRQVPALTAAGWQVITVDFRGMPPSTVPVAPLRVADLVADIAAFIEERGIGPCRIVGASLGAMVAQELALHRPDLVTSAVLLGTRGRTDYFRSALACAQAAHIRAEDTGSTEFEVVASLLTMFSARTLADDAAINDWLAVLRAFPVRGLGPAAQYEASVIPDRTEKLRCVDRPCLVVAFTEDRVAPPAMCREVADAIPGSRYVEIPGCGHFGFLERADVVNAAMTDFLSSSPPLPSSR